MSKDARVSSGFIYIYIVVIVNLNPPKYSWTHLPFFFSNESIVLTLNNMKGKVCSIHSPLHLQVNFCHVFAEFELLQLRPISNRLIRLPYHETPVRFSSSLLFFRSDFLFIMDGRISSLITQGSSFLLFRSKIIVWKMLPLRIPLASLFHRNFTYWTQYLTF